jgi:7-carboxy-7-deazaguanine synthase
MDNLLISEVFGPTVQGEGSAAGRHCLFVRLGLCNLECTWCDTPYTWAFSPEKAQKTASGTQYDKDAQLREMTAIQVIDALKALWDIEVSPTMIVISGGEPLMQRNQLVELVRLLKLRGCPVHIETAGTLLPPAELTEVVTQYNISPKLANSGNVLSKRFKPSVLAHFATLDQSWFKFVVTSPAELDEVDGIVAMTGMRADRVMIMPEGVTAEDTLTVARRMADTVIGRGFGLTLRNHILLWRDVRGR